LTGKGGGKGKANVRLCALSFNNNSTFNQGSRSPKGLSKSNYARKGGNNPGKGRNDAQEPGEGTVWFPPLALGKTETGILVGGIDRKEKK